MQIEIIIQKSGPAKGGAALLYQNSDARFHNLGVRNETGINSTASRLTSPSREMYRHSTDTNTNRAQIIMDAMNMETIIQIIEEYAV